MKQYLHTIMRSLCIMVMLCGISNSAWADDWSTFFSLENSGEEMSETNRYIINDWDNFYGYATGYFGNEPISTEGVYFKISDEIDTSSPIVMSATPSKTLQISSDHLDMNGHTISIGESSSPVDYPKWAYFHELFSDTDLEANVTYHYALGEDDWSEFSSIDWCSNERVYFYLAENIGIESAPTSTLGFDEDHFNFNNCTLTVGDDGDPIGFPQSGFYPVFSNETLEADIKYYFSISEETEWSAFIGEMNNLNPERVKVIFTYDVTITSFPSDQITFSNIEFASECELYIGDGSLDINNYEKPVFGGDAAYLNSDSSVKYNLSITDQAGIQKLYENKEFFRDKAFYVYPSQTLSGYYDLTGYDFVDEYSNPISFCYLPADGVDEDSPIKFLNADGKGNLFSYDTDESTQKYAVNYSAPSCYLIDNLLRGALFDKDCRGTDYESTCDYDYNDLVSSLAGYGTEDTPYLIYTYGMLKKLVEIVNAADGNYTSGMYIKLASDINMQGNERLTDIDGNITLDGYNTETVQFTNAFKGHFDGDNHSIGGLTRPLFSSLDGAEITNLGIVDCNMTSPALVSETATGSTISMSYVSGVSNGLIPASGITATKCYAWNTSTKTNTAYSLTAATTLDASGTHQILTDNCYTLTTDVYSDCTLFIPTSNDFYTYSSTPLNISDNYIPYIHWAEDFDWIESPCKSNAALLHNVLYQDFWNKNTCNTNFAGYGGVEVLSHLYSWYIVDKKAFTVPSDPFRVKNIYYSRNNTSTTSPAPDGLNTIYLPFAWNPATDLYYTNNGVEERITDATVHILADKLNESVGVYSFSDDAYYKDYSMEKSLLFFDPVDDQAADNRERYNDFANISNALPTLLNIPEGKSGWYIKRTDWANYGIKITDNKEETINGETITYPNLYDRYWEDPSAINNSGDYDESAQKKGRSFMEIGRLGTEWSDGHDSYYESYTRTIHYTCEETSSSISGCGNQKQINKTDAEMKTVCITDNDKYSSDYSIYKANANGDIAIDGDVKILTIYQAESIINGDQRPLTIYQVDENGNNVQDENNSDICIQTSEDDQIFLDSEGYPVKIILADGNVEIELTRESDKTTGEVVSGSGTLQGNVLVEIGTDYPYYYETSSSDRIVVDNEGYPKMIIINYSSDPVEIEINRDGSSITGTVISGDYSYLDAGNKVVINDNNSSYPLSFYVCGGHEETDDCTWSGSDFPGRAYHLGTFSGIAKNTFGAGTYGGEYKCYKLNSAGDGFAKVTANSTVQPFRTFFAIAPAPDTNAPVNAPALKLGFCGIYDDSEEEQPEQPTSIDGAPVQGIHLMTTDESKIYSIDGRYVGQYGNKKLAPGMYIMNGKKFVVK